MVSFALVSQQAEVEEKIEEVEFDPLVVGPKIFLFVCFVVALAEDG